MTHVNGNSKILRTYSYTIGTKCKLYIILTEQNIHITDMYIYIT